MEIQGYSEKEALNLANAHEFGFDSKADQEAIKQGHAYKLGTDKIVPGDLKVNDDDVYNRKTAEKIPTPVPLKQALDNK